MQTLRVELGPRSYDIAIGNRVEDQFGAFVRPRVGTVSKALFVADSNTQSLAERMCGRLGFGTVAAVPAGEGSKCLNSAGELYSRLAAIEADRKTPVVAVGGGVVGDLAGFAAATYNRGLPLLMVPTSLLAMVDSSVGGKVGINIAEGKNLVGAFHQPVGVWIDTAFLTTLPEREYQSGLAEVVKYGVILDADFFAWLERNTGAVLDRQPAAVEHIVARSCRLKANVVQQDEREVTGVRMVLNYGHTFAHAFEAVGGYGAWLHGEAVAAGMMCASRLAERRGLVDASVTERQAALLTRFGLPTTSRPEWDVDALLAVMRRDKKNSAGRLRFILPTRIGHVTTVDDVPESIVRESLTAP